MYTKHDDLPIKAKRNLRQLTTSWQGYICSVVKIVVHTPSPIDVLPRLRFGSSYLRATVLAGGKSLILHGRSSLGEIERSSIACTADKHSSMIATEILEILTVHKIGRRLLMLRYISNQSYRRLIMAYGKRDLSSIKVPCLCD